ncbi:hypothetical protein PUN28_008526 [Cardiocondyla obscurior]|uniref:Uncharacterized protein n=1 Tax=Cardiocondyla obscurior TaxID=286306 RepID=A0AAW2G178_9HYME
MLAVPSRCSIFRAFRYFPINRKARARERSLARSLARSLGRSLAQIGTKRSTYTRTCAARASKRPRRREHGDGWTRTERGRTGVARRSNRQQEDEVEDAEEEEVEARLGWTRKFKT